jgi:hypothetical protein
VPLRPRSLARPEYKRASCFAGAGNCTALSGLHSRRKWSNSTFTTGMGFL